MRLLAQIRNGLLTALALIGAAAVLTLMAHVMTDVVLRNLINAPVPATYEIVTNYYMIYDRQVVYPARLGRVELKDMVEILLAVNAGAYVIEGANARHEHEYVVWDDVKLPDGKIPIPGVITHSTDLVEHPELVAQRICRFAERVGKENVIAGADCGFGGRSHPQIAWTKLQSLVDGADLATRRLY